MWVKKWFVLFVVVLQSIDCFVMWKRGEKECEFGIIFNLQWNWFGG